ncbi:MAG: FAD:protein FMN transferase, partial [Xanthomonadales bacterium]|nr:FAD:protein FMN transferase [Xanthomonadales bacterium]
MKLYRQKFLSMGCPCEIGVFSNDQQLAEKAIAGAENEVHRLDRKYSHFKPDSYISCLQSDAHCAKGVKVDTETSALLDYAATQYELSDGLFDITAGRLSQLWHQRDTLPDSAELDDALFHTGWTKLSWQNQRLTLPANMQIELGGLVKEYAADRAALLMKRSHMNSAFVELGGDIHVTGPRPDDQPWNMGIRKPDYQHSKDNKAIASI